MASSPYWTAQVYLVSTGRVVQEIPMLQDPSFSRQINTEGSFSIVTQVGGDTLSRDQLRSITEGGRFGIALIWNMGAGASDFIAAAGPIWTTSYDDTINQLTIGGSDTWGLLDATLMVPGSWVLSDGFGDTTSVATYGPDNYSNIAIDLLNAAVARTALNVAVPATAGSGTNTMIYYGYDMSTVGQRLQDLTQLSGGPDIDFVPYFSAPGMISFQAVVGTPYINYNMQPVYFDYKSSLPSITVSSDSSHLASTVYVKGDGTEAETTWASANDPTLPNAGWPVLEWVDNTRASTSDQPTLQNWANADLALYGRPLETWTATARMDKLPYFGGYLPGMYCTFNVNGHPWIPDGAYSQRIIGYQQGDNPNEIDLILQATSGAV